MTTALCLAMIVVAQEDPPGPLGQPAGWSAEDAVSLIAIAAGSELRLEPDPAARVLAVLPEARLPLVETRDSWVKVSYGDWVGWVDLEARRGPASRNSSVPAPRILVAESEPLDIGSNWQEGELGPYRLFSRVEEPALIDYLGRVVGDHVRIYAERYGLGVEAGISGSVVLFASRPAFLEFQRSHGHGFAESRIGGYFRSPDTVLMYRGTDSRQKLAATLVHELTHLINWQTLRGMGRVPIPMPPWLEEGLAGDMSLSGIDRKQHLRAEPLGLTNLLHGRRLGVVLLELDRDIGLGGTAPSLPQLLTMNKEVFLTSDSQRNYLMSALWIRFLLDSDPRLAGGFHEYLASATGGGPMDPEALRSRLGRGWPQLAADFRGWLVLQRKRFGL